MKKYIETEIANFYLLNDKIIKIYKNKYKYLLTRIPFDKLIAINSKYIVQLEKYNIDDNYCEYSFFKSALPLNIFFRDSCLNYMDMLNIFTQIAKGIDTLHSYNLVHNDIRMMNILINFDKEIKINDFDFLKILENNDMKLIDIYSFANILLRFLAVQYEWNAIKDLKFTYNTDNLDYSSCISFLNSLDLNKEKQC